MSRTCRIQKLLSMFVLVATLSTGSLGQKRDYLTESEIELVRENQQIDLRIGILSKAVDRRLFVLEGAKGVRKKEDEAWGPLPEGSPSQLLRDIDQLIGKAISDIDDVAERNARGEFFNKAVHAFAEDCGIFIPRFLKLSDSLTDERDRGSLTGAASQCADVIKAAQTLPKETPKDSKKKKQ